MLLDTLLLFPQEDDELGGCLLLFLWEL